MDIQMPRHFEIILLQKFCEIEQLGDLIFDFELVLLQKQLIYLEQNGHILEACFSPRALSSGKSLANLALLLHIEHLKISFPG